MIGIDKRSWQRIALRGLAAPEMVNARRQRYLRHTLDIAQAQVPDKVGRALWPFLVYWLPATM